MTTSIVDIFKKYKNESDTTFDTEATEYANLDIEWVVKDGNQTISANTSWGSATADTRNLLVLVKGNLTVDAGYTLTAAARKRGMFIYVNGDLNLNGIISMTARGASAAGQRVLLLDNGSEYEVPAAGGAGGAAAVAPDLGASHGNDDGNNGTSGVATGACGGGGSGGADSFDCVATSGAGATGTSYSGGSGGGAIARDRSTATADSGAADGAAGGNASTNTTNNSYPKNAGGGAGNPGGAGSHAGNVVGTYENGDAGTGGLLVIYIYGTITFGAAGTLTSLGAAGGDATAGDVACGGGGSGGGHIDIFYKAVSGTPAYDVSGGIGGAASSASNNRQGGAGGDGSSRATEVSLPDLMGSNKFFMFM